MRALCEAAGKFGPPAGRVLLALLFLVAGYGKLAAFDGTVAYIAGKGLPLPQAGAVIAIVVELGAGILLVLGWQARWAAAVLFVFLVPTTVIFHGFWSYEGSQARMEQIQFLKNLCIMGGMLYVVAFGAGPLSIDNRRT